MQPERPDFSDVRSGSSSLPAGTPGANAARADFSDVRGGSSSVPADAPAPTAAARSYTVRKGDTLSAIAQRVYGRASRWPAIFEANRDRLDDPDRIQPGQVLRLPDAPDA